MLNVPDLLYRLTIPFKESEPKLLANCPAQDHPDKTQRWMVWSEQGPRNGRHKCLSCGFAGGPVKLVMERLQCDRAAALAFLDGSDRVAPLSLDVEVVTREPRRSAVLIPLDVTLADLHAWPDRFEAYLVARAVTAEQVERWGLGYVERADERPVLRNRIWMPVRDQFGGLCSWTARAVAKNATPKYLSASTADGADLSALMGEVFWPPPEERDELVVVEGPFDALAIDRLARPVAALRGSDLSPGQANKLSTWRRIVVATDPDTAGYKARELINGIRRHVEVAYASLPHGLDVADLSVEDAGELERRLRNAE